MGINSKKGEAYRLKKILGVSFGIAVVIGGTIGVGILRNPGVIASLLPNYWLILFCWALGGLYVLIAAGSYAELTTMMPKAGGAYNYIKRAFGDYAGFLSGWFDYFINAIAPAFFCIALSEYFLRLFPALEISTTVLAVVFLSLFTIIHVPGIRVGSASQQITSAIKVILFILLIVFCFLFGRTDNAASAAGASLETLTSGAFFLAFFQALQLIVGSYNGWMSVSFFAEEDENPGKNIPKSYFIGAIAVTSL
ncbi:MAG TPA: amino acid permease, partial [Sphingobacteriaceae bacterium]